MNNPRMLVRLLKYLSWSLKLTSPSTIKNEKELCYNFKRSVSELETALKVSKIFTNEKNPMTCSVEFSESI